MKNHVLFVGLLLIVGSAFAQNKTLGVGVATPNPNAALHVESPTGNQGFIMPRLTTVQRTDPAFISSLTSSSARGLMVFDNDSHEFYVWNDTAWVSLVLSTGMKPIEIKGTSDFSLITASVTTGPVNAISGISSSNDPGSYAVLGQNNFSGPGGVFFSKEGTALMGQTQSNVGGALAPVGVYGESTGTGSSAAAFRINNVDNSFSTVFAETNGLGAAGIFQQINTQAWTPAIVVTTDGQGAAFNATSSSVSTNANAAEFIVSNPTNPRHAIFATTSGTGTAIYGETATGWAAVRGENNGTGDGVFGRSNGTGAAVAAETSSGWTSVHGNQLGTSGNAGFFVIDNASNNAVTLNATTTGTGSAGNFTINNPQSNAAGISATTNGTGASVFASTSTGYSALAGQHNGSSDGFGGLFEITNSSNSFQAIKAQTNGTGGAAFFENINSAGTGPNVQSTTNSPGGAYRGTSTGSSGFGAWFEITNSSNNDYGLGVETAGSGTTIFANHTGASGSLAVLQSNGSNVARIDKTGQAFFNGGTQTSGADVAEMFSVEGERSAYEPGDVLVISEDTDRTVEKSSEPGSTRVAGVYATKPGVKLTERSVNENLDDLVPMGVLGVIPTKVCLENGPIKRGDLLVTSSKAGHAMKAIPTIINGVSIYPAGAILGKALENFNVGESGLIKVLVNVK